MQCFKLVNGGYVDKVIVFDSLPERLLRGVKTRAVAGFPRAWARFLAQINSVRDVLKTETIKNGPGDYTFKYTPIGKEPCFFVLDYMDTNADKEAWHSICEYLRMNCDEGVRLKEKIEDMALSMAQKSTDPLAIEPEDIPVVPVPEEIAFVPSPMVNPGEVIMTHEIDSDVKVAAKKRGRPKKTISAGV